MQRSRTYRHPPMKSRIKKKKRTNATKSTIQIGCVGDGGIGAKSSLLSRYIYDKFSEEYDPTIEDRIPYDAQIGGMTKKVEFIDTSGQEEYAISRKQALAGCKAFIVGYDITNRNSFDALPAFLNEIKRATKKKLQRLPLVLVGNKVDLDGKRQVPSSDGVKLAFSLDCAFFETSAKTGHNVASVFKELFLRISREQSGSRIMKLLPGSSPHNTIRQRSRTAVEIVRRDSNPSLSTTESTPLLASPKKRKSSRSWLKRMTSFKFEETDVNFCAFCGSLLHQQAKFCGICGYNVDIPTKPT